MGIFEENKSENQKIQAKEKLQRDLHSLQKSWDALVQHEELAKDLHFLNTMAVTIENLEDDTIDCEKLNFLKDKAEIIHYLLSTPWGAPFVSETTLLDAAHKFHEKQGKDPALSEILTNFASYSHEFNMQVFNLFEDVYRQIKRS